MRPVLAALLLLAAAPATAAPRPCTAPGAVTVRETRDVRVYRFGSRPLDYRICHRPTGRVTRFTRLPQETVIHVDAIRGRYVAARVVDTLWDSRGAEFTSVYVMDARSGRRHTDAGALIFSDDNPVRPSVTPVQLRRDGIAAWLVRPAGTRETSVRLATAGRDAVRTLATDPGIGWRSLSLDGERIQWSQGAGQRRLPVPRRDPGACRALPGSDLAPAPAVRLVRRPTADGELLVGCVLPAGAPQVVTGAFDLDPYIGTYALRAVAGATVAFDEGEGGREVSGRTAVFNLRTGWSYTFADGYDDRPAASAVHVRPSGRAIAAIEDAVAGTVEIVAFSPSGAPTVLDAGPAADIPPASLMLAGDRASWTHAGAPRAAALP